MNRHAYMERLLLSLSLVIFSDLKVIASPQQGSTDPDRRIVSLMRRAFEAYVYGPNITESRTSRDWAAAVFYVGVGEAMRATSDSVYAAELRLYGNMNGWEMGSRLRDADHQCIAQAYLDFYSLEQDSSVIRRVVERLDTLVRDFTPLRIDWNWCDALFMAPPIWSRMARHTGDTAYVHDLDRRYRQSVALLFDSTHSLFVRDTAALNERDALGRRIFWSRGNGWVFAGLARLLDALQEGPARDYFLALYRRMAETLVSIQPTDGAWRTDLLNPDRFPKPEATGTALFTYGLSWGLNNGILTDEQVWTTVRTGWLALERMILADGRLGWMQRPDRAPSDFQPEDSFDYGIGLFLMAGSQASRVVPVVTRLTGAHDPASAGLPMAYPNPTRSSVHVAVAGTTEPGLLRLEVYNILGQRLYVDERSIGAFELSFVPVRLHDMPFGTYFVRTQIRGATASTNPVTLKILRTQ